MRVKIWGVYRCPSLLLSRLKAELSGKENTPNLDYKNAPVRKIWLGMKESTLTVIMIGVKWRVKKKNFTSKEVRFRFLPLTWMGREIPRVETKLRFDPQPDREMKYLIKEGSGSYPYPDWAEMKYLIKEGSGLYPYPDWAENKIPHQMRLRFNPLS